MDDSSDTFKASQSKHAENIRISRELEKITGLSRGQIRERMKVFGEISEAIQRDRTNAQTVVKVNDPAPQEMQIRTEQFLPKPLTLGGPDPDIGNNSSTGNGAVPPLLRFDGCQNGVPASWDIPAQGPY